MQPCSILPQGIAPIPIPLRKLYGSTPSSQISTVPPKNANLLWWHKHLYFIDHGASLYFHHNWRNPSEMAMKPFAAIEDHILLPWADNIAEVDRELRARLTDGALRKIIEAVPSEWLAQQEGPSAEGYLEYFRERLAKSRFVEDALRAHAELV